MKRRFAVIAVAVLMMALGSGVAVAAEAGAAKAPATPFTIVGGGGQTVSIPCTGAGEGYECQLHWGLTGDGRIRVRYWDWVNGTFLTSDWQNYSCRPAGVSCIYTTDSPISGYNIYLPVEWEGQATNSASKIYFYSVDVY